MIKYCYQKVERGYFMEHSIKKEIIRLPIELIVTVQVDDQQIITNLKKEAEEQATKYGLKLKLCEVLKTVTITLMGSEEKIQKAYEFYTLK